MLIRKFGEIKSVSFDNVEKMFLQPAFALLVIDSVGIPPKPVDKETWGKLKNSFLKVKVPAGVSFLWQQGTHSSQLDSAFGAGLELGRHSGLAALRVPQAALCPLPKNQHRGPGGLSPLFAGDPAAGH
jgi:hypothetical protein